MGHIPRIDALPGHEVQGCLLYCQGVRLGAKQQLPQLVRNLQGGALARVYNAPGFGVRHCVVQPLLPLRRGTANHQVLAARGRFGKHIHPRWRACHRRGS